jgi:hypothetical protein
VSSGCMTTDNIHLPQPHPLPLYSPVWTVHTAYCDTP